MKGPSVRIEGVRTAMSVEQMIANLRKRIAGLPPNHTDARCAAILLDVMPGFIRSLAREQLAFTAQTRADLKNGLQASETGTLDDFLIVMTLPLVNMLGTVLTALVPCRHGDDPCQNCEELRVVMMDHVLINLERGVRAYVTNAIERNHNGHKLHS